MTSLYDIASTSPLRHWLTKQKHIIRVHLVTGQTLIMRSSLQDLKRFKCTPYMLRNGTPWLQDTPNDVLTAISDLVDAKFLQLAHSQLQIAQFCTLVITNLTQKNYTYTRTTLVGTLAHMLLEHEPTATLAGWPIWLQTVIDYCKEQQT
jgi:hypothetical protein